MNHSKHTLRDVVLINTDGFRVDPANDGESTTLRELPRNSFIWKKAAPLKVAKWRKLLLPSPWRARSSPAPKNRVAAVTN
jgi:hypothetical protein